MARRESHVPSLLRDERLRRGVAIKDIAREIGYHPSYISGVELGRLRPSEDFLGRYARGLGLPSDFFTTNGAHAGIAPTSHEDSFRSNGTANRAAEITSTLSSPVSAYTAVSGRREVLRAAIDLVCQAGNQPGNGKEVLIVGDGRLAPFEFQELLPQWRSALRSALENGWVVESLWRLDSDKAHTMTLAMEIAQLVALNGSYRPLYFIEQGGPTRPYSLIHVSGFGGMLLFATQTPSLVDSAIIFKGTPPDLLRSHFECIRLETKPLLTVSGRHGLAWHSASTRVESAPGDRLHVSDQLSVLTRPMADYQPGTSWYTRYIAEVRSKRETHTVIESRRARYASFEEHIKSHRYWQIASKRSVRSWARTGLPTDLPTSNKNPDTPEERIARLNHTIELLDKYGDRNFKIALLDESEERVLGMRWLSGPTEPTVAWTVKGDSIVKLVTRVTEGKNGAEIGVLIEQPIVADAFRDYFGSLWRHISPRNHDRSYVTSWLTDLIEEIHALPPGRSQGLSTG